MTRFFSSTVAMGHRHRREPKRKPSVRRALDQERRQQRNWHTGSMTRRATMLDAIKPDPVAPVHPLDLADMGGQPGEPITIASRRGEVVLCARADDSSPRGSVFVPFCY